MSSIPKQSNLNIRLDSNLKKEAETLFRNLGLNMTSAINVFLTQSVREQRIPFEICEKKPSHKLKKALKEAEKIARDPNVKSYDNVDEMFKDILDWNII